VSHRTLVCEHFSTQDILFCFSLRFRQNEENKMENEDKPEKDEKKEKDERADF